MNDLPNPLHWMGGKANMVRHILPLLPPHQTWVEVFGGGAALTTAKPPSPVETYNDIHGGLYAFFKCLADPALFEQFHRRVALAPVSRQYHNECWDSWATTEDVVERGAMFFVAQRQNFSGCTTDRAWGYAVATSARGMASTASQWLGVIEGLPELHARYQRVQVENNDWRKILRYYDRPDTLVYCDPPYTAGTRTTRASAQYAHEMTDDDHAELVERLMAFGGMVVLSGYPTPIYQPLEDAGWERRTFDMCASSAPSTLHAGTLGAGSRADQRRTECVWRNPAATYAAQPALPF